MATSNESNKSCSVCTKSSVKYHCIGCKRYFCPKDFKDHEQDLLTIFDNEIVQSHDDLLDQLQASENVERFGAVLFSQIEQWRESTIKNIEDVAQKVRHQLVELINSERIKVKTKTESITNEIRSRKEDDNYLENDIDRLKSKINEMKLSLQRFAEEDRNKSIIVDNNRIDWNRLIYIRNEQQEPDNGLQIQSSNLSISNESVVDDNNDIRLCTIYRTYATDTLGLTLEYHRRQKYHSLEISRDPDGQDSNAERAGVKNDDRLIEINDECVEHLLHEQVTRRIRAIQYPNPTILLVATAATVENYKRQGIQIQSCLPNVVMMDNL